jgi:hypothetical protein
MGRQNGEDVLDLLHPEGALIGCEKTLPARVSVPEG